MLHLLAYAQAISAAPAAAQALDPVPDSTITIAGKHIYVPDKYNMLLYAFGLAKAGTLTRSSVQAPSLREMFFPEVDPLRVGTNFDTDLIGLDLPQNPIQLVTNEGMDFYSDGNNGATAVDVYGLVIMSDAKIAPVSGKIFTIYATAAVDLSASSKVWVNGAITLDQELPVGDYDIVGMRAMGTGLVAARLVFIGASAVTRAGVPAQGTPNVRGFHQFRWGNPGVLGTFNSLTPPSVDCLGDTGTSQQFAFDLIKH